MRKFVCIILIFVYPLLTSGVVLQLHYCGGKLSSVSLALSDAHSCSCGSKSMKKGCCKNESLHVKVKGDHKTSNNVLLPLTTCNNIGCVLPVTEILIPQGQYIVVSNYHSPPPKLNTHRLAFLSVFRI